MQKQATRIPQASMIMVWLDSVLIFGLARAVDLITTLIAFRLGSHEANPIIAATLHYGLGPMIAFNCIAAGSTLIWLIRTHRLKMLRVLNVLSLIPPLVTGLSLLLNR